MAYWAVDSSLNFTRLESPTPSMSKAWTMYFSERGLKRRMKVREVPPQPWSRTMWGLLLLGLGLLGWPQRTQCRYTLGVIQMSREEIWDGTERFENFRQLYQDCSNWIVGFVGKTLLVWFEVTCIFFQLMFKEFRLSEFKELPKYSVLLNLFSSEIILPKNSATPNPKPLHINKPKPPTMKQALSAKRQHHLTKLRRQTLSEAKQQQRTTMLLSCPPLTHIYLLVLNCDLPSLNSILLQLQSSSFQQPQQQQQQQLSDLVSLFRRLWDQDQDHPTLTLTVFKILCHLKVKQPDWSKVCVQLWQHNEIVVEIVHCFRNKLIKMDEHMNVNTVVRRLRQAEKGYWGWYMELIGFVGRGIGKEEITEVMKVIDEVVGVGGFKESGLGLLGKLCMNSPGNCQLAMQMDNVGVIFESARYCQQAFELCVNLVLNSNCPTIILQSFLPTISHYLLSESQDLRLCAYSCIPSLLTSSLTPSILHLLNSIPTRYTQQSPTIRLKILQVLISLMLESDSNSPQIANSQLQNRNFFLQNPRCVQIVLDALYVRNTEFVAEALEGIRRVVGESEDLKRCFVAYGLGEVLENMEGFAELRGEIEVVLEEIRGIREQG